MYCIVFWGVSLHRALRHADSCHVSNDNLNLGLVRGRAITFRQLQNIFQISFLGFEKCSVVDVSVAKMANFMIKSLLFQVFRSEHTKQTV